MNSAVYEDDTRESTATKGLAAPQNPHPEGVRTAGIDQLGATIDQPASRVRERLRAVPQPF